MPAGITVTSIVNTNGNITANVAASCAAAAGDPERCPASLRWFTHQHCDAHGHGHGALLPIIWPSAPNHPAHLTGATISPAVTVQVLNRCNLLMTSATNNITLGIGTNPVGGTLSGTLTKAAVGGPRDLQHPLDQQGWHRLHDDRRQRRIDRRHLDCLHHQLPDHHACSDESAPSGGWDALLSNADGLRRRTQLQLHRAA